MSLKSVISSLKDLKPFLRFAPNPNFFCTLGHVKGLVLLDHLTKATKGKLNLRFDDTDPSEQYQKKYYNSFLRACYNFKINIAKVKTCSTDLKNYQKEVKRLIQEGKAYLCRCEKRVSLKDNHCSCFQKQFPTEGLGPEVQGVVRFKTNLFKEPDYAIYRKKGQIWYPTIALQGPVDEHLHDTTVILRGRDLESLTRRQEEVFKGLYGKDYPPCYYWGRIKLYDDFKKKQWMLSKSLKTEGFPSLKGFQDLGYSYNAIKSFLLSYGLTKNDIKCDLNKLAYYQVGELHKLKLEKVALVTRRFLKKRNSFYFVSLRTRTYYYWNAKKRTLVRYVKPAIRKI